MTDLESILPLWQELEAAGAEYVLATVVAVEGSSYRKPGAFMLLAEDGRRAGTVSGGCLEAEVARRSWWLTAQGPVVERYSTASEDDERPYGSGCGGVVYLLLEHRKTAGPLRAALEAAFDSRTRLAVATILDGPQIGRRAFAVPLESPAGIPGPSNGKNAADCTALQDVATRALEGRTSIRQEIDLAGTRATAWADYRPARPGLWIFGAGDDASPMARLARELGWFVAVADGRSNLATRARFPAAGRVSVLPMGGLDDAKSVGEVLPALNAVLEDLKPTDAAIVMSHSFEQDSRILAALLNLDSPLAYIGVLGPRRRTRELLVEAAGLLRAPDPQNFADRWLGQVHSPAGLDLGAETPASIALSILAEIQQALSAATGLPMSQVRADTLPIRV